MKVVIATLLFISTAEAIRNLVGLPEDRSSRLHQLLKDGPIDAKKLSNPYNSKTISALADLFEKQPLNDHDGSDSASGESGSGSGESGSGFVGSSSGMEPDTLKALVQSLLKIGPALKELKEKRDEKIAKTGKEFIDALKYKDDDEILILFGRHAVEEHKECDDVKHKFANYVHHAVLYELLEGQDTLNFQQDLAYVLEAAKLLPDFDALKAFSLVTELHGLQDHPGIKAIVVIGELVAEAACDQNLDGLLNKIGELIEEHDPHNDIDFASRIDLDLYMDDSKVCKGGDFINNCKSPGEGISGLKGRIKKESTTSSSLVKRLEPPPISVKDRLLDLMFSYYHPPCNEVKIIRFAVGAVIDSIDNGHQFARLYAITKVYEYAMINRVKYYLKQGQEDEAHKTVGEYLLANFRAALTVGLAVEKRFEPQHTGSEPTGSKHKSSGGKQGGNGSKPRGSKPGGRKP